MGELTGRVAVITGAGSGIGRAIALALAADGADVLATDLDGARAEATRAEVAAQGRRAVALAVDVRDRAALWAMADLAIKRLGRLDICVANAGIGRWGSVLTMDEADWDVLVEVNLKGVFLTVQACARAMVRQNAGGRIITIASIAAEVAPARLFAYSATKAGVRMMTRCWAQDLAPYGITVNCIGPGWVETPLAVASLGDVRARAVVAEANPLGRLATVEDVAGVAAFLASDRAAYLTGTYTLVDGGMADRTYDPADGVTRQFTAIRAARREQAGDELLAEIDRAAERGRAAYAEARERLGLA